MILVDSSVWIDYFRGKATIQTAQLDRLLDSQELALGDLIFTEVLQGCKHDEEFDEVRRLLGRLDLVVLGGEDVAVEAAKNYRKLRRMTLSLRRDAS